MISKNEVKIANNRIEWGYIAAFIDADGWITSCKNNNCSTTSYTIGLTQSSIQKEGMDKIMSFLKNEGIRCYSITRKGWKSKNDMIVIHIKHQASLLKVLNNTKDHLLFKKEKAEECIEYLEKRIKKNEVIKNFATPNKNQEWISSDIETLITLTKKGYKEAYIARELGRTTSAIHHKINRLKNEGAEP